MAVLAVTMVSADPAAAQSEERFTFQGRLANSQGVVVPNGPRTLTFRLYTSGSAATPIWTETQQVTVQGGLFRANLGAVTPLSVMQGTVWVGVQVQGEAVEMVPRIPIYPPPVAVALRHLRTEPGGTLADDVNIIGGSSNNTITPGVNGAVLFGGALSSQNQYQVTDNYSTVSGGWQNQAGNNNGVVTDAAWATVGGGSRNTASGDTSTVSGGIRNTASGNDSTVSSGIFCQATGISATVPGGALNQADGNYSLAAGFQARAFHHGSFVWADSQSTVFSSTSINRFAIRAENAVRVAVNTGDGVGGVGITDGLYVRGSKSFRIDHPLDPASKYRVHNCAEGPEALNIDKGRVTTNANGEAVVSLPSYFEALNRNVDYQFTCIGQFAQAIVAVEILGNRFTIRTDKPNVKVSWQVTGVRNGAYMQAHPTVVEPLKSDRARTGKCGESPQERGVTV